jgi:hypothetical protein
MSHPDMVSAAQAVQVMAQIDRGQLIFEFVEKDDGFADALDVALLNGQLDQLVAQKGDFVSHDHEWHVGFEQLDHQFTTGRGFIAGQDVLDAFRKVIETQAAAQGIGPIFLKQP